MTKLKTMVQTYSDQHLDAPKINYLARKKIAGVPHHYKSGNLRFGFDESAKLFPSPYVASLDADSIVHRLWLRRALPHLLLGLKLDLINVRNVSGIAEYRSHQRANASCSDAIMYLQVIHFFKPPNIPTVGLGLLRIQ